MKQITLHIERLPEGELLATSKDVPGLVVEAETIDEVVEGALEVIQSFAEIDAELEGESKAQRQPKSQIAQKICGGPDRPTIVYGSFAESLCGRITRGTPCWILIPQGRYGLAPIRI